MDCVIGISDATTASHARCIPPDRLITIRNGVDVDRFAPLEQPTRDSVRRGFRGGPNVLHAVHIGRLEPGKRVDAAIRALPALTSEIVLHLIGDGPERFNLESLARTIGVADRVVFHGVRRDVPSILPAMDVLVMPSESEGLPLVILEAMACGVTVIASRVGGIPEIVHDGRTGLLIPPGDAQALAVALARLHDDPALRGQLALGGRALALAEHRIEDVAQRFWNLCRERLAATGQASPCG